MLPLKPLGQAAKVADKDSTVIVEGSGNPEAIANRVALSSHKSKLQLLNLTVKTTQERLAKLSGGVAVIRSVLQLKQN